MTLPHIFKLGFRRGLEEDEKTEEFIREQIEKEGYECRNDDGCKRFRHCVDGECVFQEIKQRPGKNYIKQK